MTKSWLERAKLHAACSKSKARGSRFVEVEIPVLEALLESHAALHNTQSANRGLELKVEKLADKLKEALVNKSDKCVKAQNTILTNQVIDLKRQLKAADEKLDLLESAMRVVCQNPAAVEELRALGVSIKALGS